ncbi:MAG: SpoIIE family protein phosphatase [Clostridia bacterium]|nr:SpoIIE family protein phosphatase [Clostridia bacterium]
MKKFRRLVIGGIETKVINMILLAVILLAALFIAVAVYQSNSLSSLSAETAALQQKTIGETTRGIMDQIVSSNLERTAALEAAVADEMFSSAETRVKLLAEYAGKIYADPENYSPKPYGFPVRDRDGELLAQYLLADGLDPEDPELAASMGLTANMSDMMISLCSASESANAYIGLTNGLFLSVNRTSSDWFLPDGTLKHYDPRTRFWYIQAREAGGLIFSDVERDATTGRLSVVCAMPVYGPDGEFIGAVGTDLFIDEMSDMLMASISNGRTDEQDPGIMGGYRMVINRDGHLIFYIGEEGRFEAQTSDQAVDLRTAGIPDLAAIIEDGMRGKTGVRRVQVDDKGYYMVSEPLNTVHWQLIACYSEELADRPSAMLETELAGIQKTATQTYRENAGRLRTWTIILTAGLTLILLTGAVLLGKRIVRPLNTITTRIAEIDESDPEFRMEDAFRTGDEIEVLAQSFAALSHRTLEYVDEVQRVTAEKERIGTELHMANQIQESMLPSIFPAFPDRTEFDIYASMNPAKEVGGDFYDFFLIDDDHLCMVMADVSGKGVPAALFMMASKIIIQSCAMLGRSAAEILNKTNEAICSNNKMQLFITVWLCILEISTGKVTAANAGHEYPCVMTDGRFELMKDRHGFVIGGMDGIQYKEYMLNLHPGDKLFLYTDGVAEATNAQEELFGTQRMLDALNSDPAASPEQQLVHVRKAVDDFVGSAEQFDDLTMLCLEYRGGKAT